MSDVFSIVTLLIRQPWDQSNDIAVKSEISSLSESFLKTIRVS